MQSVSLPTGTVTFLFSDIEGSTARWEVHPEAMKTALARHDELLRHAITQHGGYVFKTGGDAFCSVFNSAPDALTAALAAQLALSREDFSATAGLRVRMGLHTGCADERDGDYFGPAVNRVARLMSAGYGGQVLLSAVTHELVQHDIAADAVFTDLGLHRLKDLAQPERIWQLNAKDMPSHFPPLRSLDALPNNLPIQTTSFHGREEDLQDLKSQLTQHRLVTLCGAGGVGKTRLAAQVGAELLDQFPDGVWIADLAPITDPGSVSSVIAKALGVSQTQSGRLDEVIAPWLKYKELLLVLDNCEHMLDPLAELADAIQRQCPNVRILATSRQALGVSGEKVLRLASLGVPAKASHLAPAAAIQFGAVALFTDRATLVDQSFQLSEDNAPIVADICRRLDGIPLAIELAAARVKVLSLPNLVQRLNDRFKILTAGSRTALPRQKTLSALIDWSYDLLPAPERTLFNRVSVFAGSFTLDAASTVCAAEPIDASDIFDMVASLADKSLIVADTSGNSERYRLLESTREYALVKLEESKERESTTRCHAQYFLQVAEKAEKNFSEVSLGEWLAALEAEVENFRAALEWSLGRSHDLLLGAAVASALEMFWWHGGTEAEGRRWLELALSRIDERTNAQACDRLRRSRALLTSRVLYS